MSSTPHPVTPPPSRRPMPYLPVTQRVGRALETRPTITVDSGQLCQVLLTKSAEKPRHSCRGWIGVGRAGLNAQAPNKTPAVPKPSMGEGTAEVEAPAFMPGRTSTA